MEIMTNDSHYFEGHSDLVSTLKCVGDHIISGSWDKSVRVWNIPDSKNHNPDSTSYNLEGHHGPITCIASFENLIATCSTDKSIRIWDISCIPSSIGSTTTSFKLFPEGHSSDVLSLDWSRDGRQIVSSSLDKSIIIWDMNLMIKLITLTGVHTKAITSVKFNADSSRVISGSYDGNVIIWNPINQSVVLELSGHEDGVNTVAFGEGSAESIAASGNKQI